MNPERLAELRRLMTELYNCGFATADGDEEDVRPSELIENDLLILFLTQEKRAEELEARLEATAKQKMFWFEQSQSRLNCIAEVESQLAWTPVSAGLPTEPGWYEFVSHLLKNVHVYTREPGDEYTVPYRWILTGTEERYENGDLELSYSYYRRIELPEAT